MSSESEGAEVISLDAVRAARENTDVPQHDRVTYEEAVRQAAAAKADFAYWMGLSVEILAGALVEGADRGDAEPLLTGERCGVVAEALAMHDVERILDEEGDDVEPYPEDDEDDPA